MARVRHLGGPQRELNLILLRESMLLIKRFLKTPLMKGVSRDFGIKYIEPWVMPWKIR